MVPCWMSCNRARLQTEGGLKSLSNKIWNGIQQLRGCQNRSYPHQNPSAYSPELLMEESEIILTDKLQPGFIIICLMERKLQHIWSFRFLLKDACTPASESRERSPQRCTAPSSAQTQVAQQSHDKQNPKAASSAGSASSRQVLKIA